MDFHEKLTFTLIIAAISGGAGVCVYFMAQERQRLMDQCMADGHKEYECHAMLKEPSPVVVPMPIYTR